MSDLVEFKVCDNKATNTVYTRIWRMYKGFCQVEGLPCGPLNDFDGSLEDLKTIEQRSVELYLSACERRGLAVSTRSSYLTAIRRVYKHFTGENLLAKQFGSNVWRPKQHECERCFVWSALTVVVSLSCGERRVCSSCRSNWALDELDEIFVDMANREVLV